MSASAPVVLVTGSAGFIGSHTVDALMATGCRVLGIDNLSAGSRANLRQWDGEPRHTFLEADVTEGFESVLDDAAARLGPIDCIVHLAAQTMVPLSIEDPITDIRVNLEGTVRMLEYARRRRIRKVVFASSSAVYDDDAPVPVSEESRVRPSSPYGIDKFGSELFLDYYARVHGLTFTTLRFMNVYGPRQDPESDYSGVISVFLDRALAGKPITIFGDGEQTRDFVHARDVARAVVSACASGVGDHAVINIGSAEETSINHLARLVLDLTGSKSPIRYAPLRPGDIRRSVTTCDRATALLGFAPTVGLREGLAETLAWVRQTRQSTEVVA
jgi:UDP-glucose 4-epimerase